MTSLTTPREVIAVRNWSATSAAVAVVERLHGRRDIAVVLRGQCDG